MPPASATSSAPGRMAKMVGVREHHLGCRARAAASVVIPFTVAEVPTGMNMGVWKSPWAVV